MSSDTVCGKRDWFTRASPECGELAESHSDSESQTHLLLLGALLHVWMQTEWHALDATGTFVLLASLLSCHAAGFLSVIEPTGRPMDGMRVRRGGEPFSET